MPVSDDNVFSPCFLVWHDLTFLISNHFSYLSISAWKLPPVFVAAAAKSLQSCPTLCDPIDGSPPGSPVPGILQARTLEWVAISFSSAWKWKVKVKSLSRVRLLATPWTAAHQAFPSMRFSRQEYWSGLPLPSPPVFVVSLNSWGRKESETTERLNWTELLNLNFWVSEWVKVTQSCLTLCNPMDCSPPASLVHEILQARILEWVAISFSRGSSQPRDQTQVSHIAGWFFTSWATSEAQRKGGTE